LHIKGSFSGTAVCGELVVAASAIVKGSITYQVLTIGRGATIEGDLIVRR
jgi:cytoskeletal protein CcmA (bactofilin family)